MEKHDAADLLTRYKAGSCTPEERAHIERWWLYYQDGATDPLTDAQVKQELQHIRKALPGKLRTIVYNYRIWAAAAILLFASIGIYLYKYYIPTADIKPGYNQATLTLADGTTVDLDSAKRGIQIRDEDISYNDGTKIRASIHHPSSITYNSLSTPKGGQYQIILSDGTKVWLNAASTLKYPSRFIGDRREVFLEGEGYFEVNNKPVAGARVPRVPFIVNTKNQQTTVLGTSFNLNSYDPIIKTTLITGAVQVASHTGPSALPHKAYTLKLSPGEQSILKGNELTKAKVNIDREIAWSQGLFDFTGKNLQEIMAELSRWYNIEVVYEGNITPMKYMGQIYRNNNLSQVLAILKSAQIQFRVEGRKLIIHNGNN